MGNINLEKYVETTLWLKAATSDIKEVLEAIEQTGDEVSITKVKEVLDRVNRLDRELSDLHGAMFEAEREARAKSNNK